LVPLKELDRLCEDLHNFGPIKVEVKWCNNLTLIDVFKLNTSFRQIFEIAEERFEVENMNLLKL